MCNTSGLEVGRGGDRSFDASVKHEQPVHGNVSMTTCDSSADRVMDVVCG